MLLSRINLSLVLFLAWTGSAWPEQTTTPRQSPLPMARPNRQQEECKRSKEKLLKIVCDRDLSQDDCFEIQRKFDKLVFECVRQPTRGDAATVTGKERSLPAKPPEEIKNPITASKDALARENTDVSQTGALEQNGKNISEGFKENNKIAGEIESGISTTKDFKYLQLDSAIKSLDRVQESFGGFSKMPPEEQQRFYQDQTLVNEVVQSVQSRKPVTFQKIESANYPEVKQKLELVASADFLENEFSKERAYVISQVATFGSLQFKNAEAQDRLASPQETSNFSAKHNNNSISDSKSLTVVKDSQTSEISAVSNLGNSPKPVSPDSKSPGKDKIKKMDLAELQKRLREKMATLNKEKKEKEALSNFSSELGDGIAALKISNSSANNEDIDPLDSLKKDFSLEGIETDQEVRRLQEEGARDLASSSGILLIDSKNLFERVSEYHRACLKKECVR